MRVIAHSILPDNTLSILAMHLLLNRIVALSLPQHLLLTRIVALNRLSGLLKQPRFSALGVGRAHAG